MSTEMAHLGELLKKKREEKNFSLKEAENLTSIRSNYLQAIEDGKIHERIASIYALGFLKQYANFLGFDLEKLIKEYPRAFKFRSELHDFSYGIGTLEVRKGLGSGGKWIPNLKWIGGGAIILTLAYYFAKIIGVL